MNDPPHMHRWPALLRPRGYDSAAAEPPCTLLEAVFVLVLFALTQLALTTAVTGLLRLYIAFGGSTGGGILLRVGLPVSLIGSHTIAWVMAYLIVKHRHGQPFPAALGLEWPIRFRLLRPFLGGMAIQMLVLAVVIAVPPPPDMLSPLERLVRQGPATFWLVLVIAVVLAPLIEEVLFRGMLWSAIRHRLRFALTALVVTVIFTGLHATQTRGYLPAIGGIFLCGMVLAWLRERTGSLWPSIAFHMGFNAMAFVPLLLAGVHQ